jgi:hypothetical protein
MEKYKRNEESKEKERDTEQRKERLREILSNLLIPFRIHIFPDNLAV